MLAYYAVPVRRGTATSFAGLLLVSAGGGCLPDDTRPEPASLELAVRSADTSSEGFVTDDGWQIELDELLAAIGTVRIEGGGCNPYNTAWYTRVFDFARPLDEPSKLALLYGVGDCSLRFRLRSPQDDSILSAGVSQAAVDAMRVEEADLWSPSGERVTLRVRGRARKDDREMSFAWDFRARYDVRTCYDADGGRTPTEVDLQSGAALERIVDIDATALFRIPRSLPVQGENEDPYPTDPAAGVPVRFDMFARADGGLTYHGTLGPEDGEITLAELWSLDADTGEPIDGEWHPGDAGDAPRSLGTALYLQMAPAIVRLEGGPCFSTIDD